MKRLPFIALAICACLSACSSTSDDAKTCSNHRDCDTGDICQNGFCIPEPECWAAKPCVDDNKRCDNGKCVDKPAPTPKKANGESCSAHDECVSSYCGFDRTCANAPACSDSMPCSNGDQYCDNGVCIDKIANGRPCNSSIVCKSGFCNAQKTCETKPECDDANPCADETKVCQNGKCIDKPHTTCDSKTPCTATGETCVAGKCVACQCGNGEICTADGTCIEHLETQKYQSRRRL